jgi:carbonic anhydrase
MTDMTRAALGALVAAVLLAGCAAPSPDRGGPAHWSYSGEAGPDRWGALHPDYALCARGRAGSPIDIATAEPSSLPAIGFDYRPGPGEVLDNGHSIQVDLPAAGQARFASGQYRLAQFHFHAPSEERFAGRAYPLGVHLVHSDAAQPCARPGVWRAACQGRSRTACRAGRSARLAARGAQLLHL